MPVGLGMSKIAYMLPKSKSYVGRQAGRQGYTFAAESHGLMGAGGGGGAWGGLA